MIIIFLRGDSGKKQNSAYRSTLTIRLADIRNETDTMHSTRHTILCATFGFLVLLSAGMGYGYDDRHAMDSADAYLKMGMYLEAIGAYRSVADNSADRNMQARAILRIGDIYSYFLDNYDTALLFYSFVTKHYSGSIHAANAYFNSGMIRYEKYQYNEALTQFQEYLARFPQGERKETAEFMIKACRKPIPSPEGKKEVTAKIGPDEMIRILIHENIGAVSIAGTEPYEIRDINRQTIIHRIPAGLVADVSVNGGFLTVNGSAIRKKEFTVSPGINGIITVNGLPYRGTLTIRRHEEGFDVINELRLEEYLYGVIPKEMSPQWPKEALKAQAVAARTYALYQKEKNHDKGYDVYASTLSQVYGGIAAEQQNTTTAVNETRGRLLTWNGKLILAYFHSNSGGVTEDAENVWTAGMPYLKSVRDKFSSQAPGVQWIYSIDFIGMQRILNQKGIRVGKVYEIVPVEVSPTGRIKKIEIVHSGGTTTLSGNDFRIKYDPTRIKSTLFRVIKEDGGVSVHGSGYGHGVGMSQWGAYEMARAGYGYTDILGFYYAGVDVK